jgi:hypothetical protein
MQQRKRRGAKNPTRRLAAVLRDVNRSFPEWEATLVEAYAATGTDRLLLFRVRDRETGVTVFQTTSVTDRSVAAERWLRSAKRAVSVC